MTAKIRAEFLTAIGAAFENMEYGIIGGAALAEYGNTRDTSDVDIVIPHEISLVVEDQLLSHGMIRTTQGGLGYVRLSAVSSSIFSYHCPDFSCLGCFLECFI